MNGSDCDLMYDYEVIDSQRRRGILSVAAQKSNVVISVMARNYFAVTRRGRYTSNFDRIVLSCRR